VSVGEREAARSGAVEEERVRIEIDGGVAQVTLARPDKHNALDPPMFEALSAAIDELGADTSVRAVVLRGEGPSFCSGLDFPSFMVEGGSPVDLFVHREGEPANNAQHVAYGWRALPVPVIAAVHGACYGGGFQIALGADVRIGAPGTRMSIMESDYGLIPDMSITQTLAGLVRDDLARELIYTARKVEAEEAVEIGLLSRIDEEPVVAATVLAEEIASRSPDAIRAAKRLVAEGLGAPPEVGLALEEELQRSVIGKPNQIAAVTAKLSGEPARFSDADGD
jgi:enoyl-CoA hydratase/carnithine racemase